MFGYWKTTINGEFKENNGLEDEFEWLNNFYELIILYRRTDLFDEYNIIPNRYGSFSIINRKTKNANNVVISSIPILLNDDVKDETLLNIYGFLEFNQRRNFVSEHVTQIITPNKITKAEIANKIADVLKKLKDTTEEQNKGIRLLMEWLEYNPEEGKELFSELYAKRAELFMQTISDKESLYSLMKSKTPLSTLVEIAEAIENDPTILKLIEDRKQEKIEELIRNEAGEFIENLLKIALEEKGFKVEKTRYGKDLVISLSNTNKIIDIEVKSTMNAGSVSMTSFQTETAIQKGKDYFLCVVNKENMAMTKESVMENSKFVSNIGSSLIEKYNQAQSFNSKKSDLEKEQEGIGIFIENISSYKYKISYDIWKNGVSFNEFINLILVR